MFKSLFFFRVRKTLKKLFKRNDRGNTAIEFAIIAPVFFLLFMSIFELGTIMLIKVSLETAIQQASRFGRTGATVTGETAQQEAQALINEYTFGIVNPSNLNFTVTPYANFAAIPTSLSKDPTTNTQNFGASSQPVLYTLTYNYNFITPIVGKFFTNNQLQITASAVVENEPY